MSDTIIEIPSDTLIPRVTTLRDEGYRIVQMCCVNVVDGLHINYSFDKDNELVTLRLIFPTGNVTVPSISHIFPSAFLYENEMHDLFGVTVTNMTLDFKGTLYQTSVKTPWKK